MPKDAGLYFAPPPPGEETLYSNLLRVSRFPGSLYVARTDYRTGQDVRAKLDEMDAREEREWFAKYKSILSFNDLSEWPWDEVCERGTVEAFDSDEWAYSEDPDARGDFVQLLNRCLGAKAYALGLRYDKDHRCYYFRATRKLGDRKLSYKSVVNETARTVFKRYAKKGSTVNLDFHNLLKAKAMNLGVPIQLLLPSTYDESKHRRQKRRSDRIRRLQDEATRAWNIYIALYYKAGGIPWRIARNSADLTSCYVGVSFYNTLDREKLLTSTAQVFNERGDGVVLRGGTAERSKDDRQIHMSGDDARKLLDGALKTYRSEHRTLPARVVVHKTSPHNHAELDGFREALDANGVDSADFLSVGRSYTRLFRDGGYPPLRGTFLSLDRRTHALYTRGSVDFFATYPG